MGAAEQVTTSARAAGLGLVGALASGSLAVGLLDRTLRAWPGTGEVALEAGLGWVVSAAATALLAWLSLVLLTGALTVLPGTGTGLDGLRRVARRCTPRGGRWVASALLVGTGAVAAAPAGATEPGSGAPPGVAAAQLVPGGMADRSGEALVEPDWSDTGDGDGDGVGTPREEAAEGEDAMTRSTWVPEPHPRRATAAADLGPLGLPQRSSSPHIGQGAHGMRGGRGEPGDGVVVRRGDTLWDIAARHLGPGATIAEIAREWPRWHAANRDTIGADPDLLLPGQLLHAPVAGR